MNIFFLDKDPAKAARALCQEHQKMILESAQLLSTAHRVLDGSKVNPALYKAGHQNHPSAVWVRQSSANYVWLHKNFEAMAIEFQRRNGKGAPMHASAVKLMDITGALPKNIPMGPFQVPPMAMKPWYRLNAGLTLEEVIASYRNYYVMAKDFATWKNRAPPEWFTEGRAKVLSFPFQLKPEVVGFSPMITNPRGLHRFTYQQEVRLRAAQK